MALRKNKTEILDRIITKAELIDYDHYWSCWDDDYGWIDCMLYEEGWEHDDQVELWIYNYDFSVSL